VVSIRNGQGVPKAWISRRIRGDQIDYADERPEVRTMFARSWRRTGSRRRWTRRQAELVELPAKVA
jgi:hypothetical protein